jgi:hypothetical protein
MKDRPIKNKNNVTKILEQITHLSKDMDEAIQQKDIARIKEVYSKKMQLIDALKSAIIAQHKK